MNAVTAHTLLYDKALAGLRLVPDPEVGLNVVDLGLIYQLQIEGKAKKIFVIMTLTTQFCPMGHSIVDGVENNLQANFPDYSIQINVTFDPSWSQAMISPEGFDFLNR